MWRLQQDEERRAPAQSTPESAKTSLQAL